MDRLVGTYAFCHFTVDFACVSTVLCMVVPMLGDAGPLAAALAIVIYDMFAFALQLPIGAALDGHASGPRAALFSYILTALGIIGTYLPGSFAAFVAVMLVALGNALFHCAGGVDVLAISHGKAAPSGLFISTGALGVFFGAHALSLFGGLLSGVLRALLLVSALQTADLIHPEAHEEKRILMRPKLSKAAAAAAALLALTVALRSFTGMIMAFPWKGEFALALVAICAVVAGKAAGGIIADTIGLGRASIISLGISAPLFLLAHDLPAAGIIATLLFNFTMPITLISLAELLPRNRGLAFGIASFSLAIGAFPTFVGIRPAGGAVLAALSLVSLACLLAGLALARSSSHA